MVSARFGKQHINLVNPIIDYTSFLITGGLTNARNRRFDLHLMDIEDLLFPHDRLRVNIVSTYGRILPIDEAQDGLTCELWTRKERIDAIKAVHSALSAVSMGNCHSAVSGIGGTARPAAKVTILRDLKKAHGAGGHLLDVGYSFGHFMLSTFLTDYAGIYG
jgi:hypothetical protein